MFGTEKLDLELARQHHADLIHQASLDRSLAVASTNADYAAGIGAIMAIGMIVDGLRGLLRWVTTPRQRPAGAAS